MNRYKCSVGSLKSFYIPLMLQKLWHALELCIYIFVRGYLITREKISQMQKKKNVIVKNELLFSRPQYEVFNETVYTSTGTSIVPKVHLITSSRPKLISDLIYRYRIVD